MEVVSKLTSKELLITIEEMAGKKVKTMAIKLVSSAGTGFFYVTTKNPRNVARKLALKKVSILFIYLFIYIHSYNC